MLSRLVPTACLVCGLGSFASGAVASQSCELSDGDSIASAISRGCNDISLGAGEYVEHLTIDRAISIAGAPEARVLSVVITSNGGPVITVGVAGDLQLSRLTLRGSGGEIVELGLETADAEAEDAQTDGEEEQTDVPTEQTDDEIAQTDSEMPPSEVRTPDLNPQGGCINNSGHTSIDYVLVTNCFAAQSGGAVYNAAGASFSAATSRFESNRAANGSGGAIASVGDTALTLSDTDFTDNMAQGWGGAVSMSGAADSITGGSFHRNRAGGHGGAVALERGGGAARLDGAVFDSNRSGSYGGAIVCFDRELELHGGEIRANRAEGGGGLYAARCNVVFNGARLLGNVAGPNTNGFGGALMLQEGSLHVTQGWFEGNQAGHSGGALFANVRPASITLEETMVRDNHAQVSGGGLRVAEAALMQVHGSTVVFNTARLGGGMHVSNGSGAVARSAFAGNRASGEGGALLISDGSMVIENSTFAVNAAGQLGGALALRAFGEASVRNATLYRNTAGDRASGLFIDAGAALGLSNTIVYDSGATVADCDVEGTLTVTGRNLDSDGSCNADVSRDPLLEALGPGATIQVDELLVDDAPTGQSAVDESPVAASDVDLDPVDEPPIEEEPLADELVAQESALQLSPPAGAAIGLEETPGLRIVPLALRPAVGSPAIDDGDDDVCTDHDQNGTPRPRDGDGENSAQCDIGAIEKR